MKTNKIIQKQLIAAASKVCTSGCIACFECGKSKSSFNHLPPFGTNKICLLEKYGVEHDDSPKDIIESLKNNPDLDDLYILCKHCEHRDSSKDKDNELSIESCFETHCMDCPVQMCRETIQECTAEAMMS